MVTTWDLYYKAGFGVIKATSWLILGLTRRHFLMQYMTTATSGADLTYSGAGDEQAQNLSLLTDQLLRFLSWKIKAKNVLPASKY